MYYVELLNKQKFELDVIFIKLKLEQIDGPYFPEN